MTKRAQKYDCLTGRIRAIVFCTIGITLLFGWADACNALTTNYLQQNLRENSLNASVKGNKSPMDSLLSFSSLMLSQNLSQESKSPVSSVYVSHITSVPPAGERQAFFELAVWSLKFEEWSCPSFRADLDRRERGVEKSFRAEPHAETAETAETPVISSAAERSREILFKIV